MDTSDHTDMRLMLRQMPTLTGQPPQLDPAQLPPRPDALHRRWLREAIADDVPEPHACVLSTADGEGRPSARVVLLKDVADGHWWFASASASPKTRDLASNPWVAITSYWPAHGRQVRIEGRAQSDEAVSRRDLQERPLEAQAMALLGRQSQPLESIDQLRHDVDAAVGRLRSGSLPPYAAWRAYRITPARTEFWQLGTHRRHLRIEYVPDQGGWSQQLLWP